METKILAPISLGDLIDRITILEIKSRVQSQLEEELVALQLLAQKNCNGRELQRVLQVINQELWDMENLVRQRISQGDDCLVADAARSIVKLNDERSRIKQQINLVYGAEFVEEKVYE